MADTYSHAAINKEDLVKRRRRPNPAVAKSERMAAAAEEMANLAENTLPNASSFSRLLATRRRKTADKIRKERPYLIEYGA